MPFLDKTAVVTGGAVAFVACCDASFITGTALVVDGGWSIAKDSL